MALKKIKPVVDTAIILLILSSHDLLIPLITLVRSLRTDELYCVNKLAILALCVNNRGALNAILDLNATYDCIQCKITGILTKNGTIWRDI